MENKKSLTKAELNVMNILWSKNAPRTIEFRDRFRVEFRDSLFLQVQNEMYALGIGLGIVFCVNFDTQNAT